jgi:outer membrane receptor protein involved in Fe transport
VRVPYFFLNNDLASDPAAREFEVYQNDQDTGEVGLRYDRRLGTVALEVYALQQLGWYGSQDDLDEAGQVTTFGLAKHTGESILRATATTNPAPTLQVQAGLEGDYNWLGSQTRETFLGLPVPVPAADVHVVELRGEAFADATWRASAALTLEAGGRIEASQLSSSGDVTSRQGFVFPKPRLVATWTPADGRQLQLRLEREVSQLDFADFTASGTLGNGEHAGNPTLTPPQDWVAEVSLDQRFWQGGDASLALRHYWLSDVIDQAPECPPGGALPGGGCNPLDEVSGPANIGAGERDEASLAVTLPTDRLWLQRGVLSVRATWRHSEVTDPATHLRREISGLHPVDAEAHFTQGLPGLRSTWGLDVYTAWRQTTYYFDEVDTQRLGTWVDAYFEWKPKPDFSLKLEADNLATHGMEYVRDLYDPFRDVAGGALTSIDARHPRFGPELTLRARKTFG